MNQLIKFIAFISIINLANCGKDVSKCPIYFTLPVSIVPIQEVYNIGDTITIISEFEDQLAGLNTELTEVGIFNMKGIKWEPRFRIYKLDTLIIKRDEHLSRLTENFQIILYDTLLNLREYSSGNETIVGEYTEFNSKFSLNFKIVCKKKGTYFFESDSGNNYGTLGFQDYPGVCKKEKLEVYFKTNEGKDNNLHYLKESPDPFWDRSRPNGYTGDVYSKEPEVHGGFCFKVE